MSFLRLVYLWSGWINVTYDHTRVDKLLTLHHFKLCTITIYLKSFFLVLKVLFTRESLMGRFKFKIVGTGKWDARCLKGQAEKQKTQKARTTQLWRLLLNQKIWCYWTLVRSKAWSAPSSRSCANSLSWKPLERYGTRDLFQSLFCLKHIHFKTLKSEVVVALFVEN